MDPITRREALTELATAAGALACGAALTGCASSGGTQDSSQRGHVSGPVDVGAAASELPGTVSDRWSKSAGFLLVRQGDHLFALSSECTHKRCSLRAVGSAFRCPCHGAAFDTAGNVTKGPAEDPLPRVWIARNEQGRIIVDASRKLEAGATSLTGSFVDLSVPSHPAPVNPPAH